MADGCACFSEQIRSKLGSVIMKHIRVSSLIPSLLFLISVKAEDPLLTEP